MLRLLSLLLFVSSLELSPLLKVASFAALIHVVAVANVAIGADILFSVHRGAVLTATVRTTCIGFTKNICQKYIKKQRTE
jgi:hypothetical protein